jgi:hypothetical protein
VYKFRPSKPYHLVDDEKGRFGKDSEFLNGFAAEAIEQGGVLVKVYRLLGTFEQTRDALNVKTDPDTFDGIDLGSFLGMGIQDTILGENRDREYDKDEIPILRGVYKINENELEYSKYGLTGLAGDVIVMEFHIQTVEQALGRRFIPGDVCELPHLREVGVDGRVSNRWYEVQAVVKSPGGFDPMYGFHVLGVTLRPMRDAQEFLDLMEMKDEYGKTLQEQASNRDAMVNLTAANQQIANEHAPTQWWDTTQMYIDPTNKAVMPYKWTDDGRPPNGIPVQSGPEFPETPAEFDYFVRTDFFPNRLYQFYDSKWNKKEIDAKREWQPYNWHTKLREFMADRSDTDKARKWQLKSIHDVLTGRQANSDPSPNDDK